MIALAASVAAALVLALAGAVPPAAAQTAQLDLLDRRELPGAGEWDAGARDVAFAGDRVFVAQRGEQGGVWILRAVRHGLVEIGFFHCPWPGTEVEAISKDLIVFLSFGGCSKGSGPALVLLSLEQPARPKVLSTIPVLGSHTFSLHPDRRHVYTSAGGFGFAVAQTEIIDVSNPRRPKEVARFGDPNFNCHDIGFSTLEQGLAACAAGAETQLWDVSDPVAPSALGTIRNPAIFFHHSAAFTDSGDLLAIGDESYLASTCAGAPTGAIWVYDVGDPTNPALGGTVTMDRGSPVSSYHAARETACTAHNFEFIPGTKTLVSSWYTGGLSVVDLSDPLLPRETGFYQDERTNYWGAYWHDGRFYASDHRFGIDVFRDPATSSPRSTRGGDA